MAKEKLYRPNVAMVLVSSKYPEEKKVFIAQRNDLVGVWQFPQGGIDNGEEVQEALFRELEEEIGTNDVQIIAEHPKWLSYDFPPRIAKSMQPYAGQTQKYFLLKFNDESKININTKHPEFNAYKFVDVDDVLRLSASFKQDVYTQVIGYFKEKGYL